MHMQPQFLVGSEAAHQLRLNSKNTANETAVYTESINNSKWVCCAKCNSYFYLKCVIVGTKQTEVHGNKKGRFVCNFMGC